MSLARQLSPDQPLYLIAPCGLDGGPIPPTYGEMADLHVRALREVLPEGPYRLGGTCNGGLVAYEMARRLEAAGQSVELLVLFGGVRREPPLPTPRRAGPRSWEACSGSRPRNDPSCSRSCAP